MYIPGSFQENRTETLHELIKAHPLGLLVTAGTSGMQASPIPFLLYPGEGEFGVLRAHMARANPHWKDLSGLGQCLVVFQGPEAYVTPSWYPSKAESHKAVPTWNYATVQAWGAPTVIDDAAWLRKQLNDLTQRHESARLEPWSVDDAPADFVADQMKAIVGIEIPIERIEGKFKMSQNRTDADRAGVLHGLGSPEDPHCNLEVAGLVKAYSGL
jgi:transcriptional regulator